MDVSDRLEVKVLEAIDLPIINGVDPDSYVEICVGNDAKRTHTVSSTTRPTWHTPVMIFSAILVNGTEAILVNVRNKNTYTGEDSILGSVSIPLTTALHSPRVELDDWYDLTITIEEEESKGKVHIQMAYFNTVDAGVGDLYNYGNNSDLYKVSDAPNLIQILVSNATGLLGDKAVEAFVSLQVGDLRKETKSARKSANPVWDEMIDLPVSDGSEILDITVKQASLIRNLFLGKVRISLNEIAAGGDNGFTKRYNLYNEHLQFDEKGNGSITLTFKWVYDEKVDAENKKKLAAMSPKKSSLLSRMAKMLTRKRSSSTSNDAIEANNFITENKSELPPEAQDLSPYELEQYMRDQTKKRRDEMAELLQIPEVEVEIPEGDYTIQVHIIEVADLKGANSSGMSDPFVVVECMGVKKQTKYKTDVVAAFFNDTFYFQFKDLKREQLSEAHLKLTVYDHNWIRSNELIGVYQVDLISIYTAADHEMHRRWASLRDPTNESETGVQGLLKFSCTVLGPGDTQKVHDPALEEEEDEVDIEHLEGAAVADHGDGHGQQQQFLVLSIVRADGLPGFDKLLSISNSGLYAFVTLDFAGCKPIKTTKVAVQGKRNLSVNFEEELWIPAWVPSSSKRAAITIVNREFGRNDLVVATIYIDFDLIQRCDKDPIANTGVFSMLGMSKKKYAGPAFEWLHLYGANPLVRMGPKQAQFMNRFPNHGSAYRGSILASLRVVKQHDGIESAHKKAMSYDIPDHLLPKGAQYLLRLMVYQGSDFGSKGANFTGKGASYSLAVSIGPHELRSNFRRYEDGSCDWVEIVEAVNISLSADMRMLPDTFITVYRGTETSNVPVAFTRLKTLSMLPSGLNSLPVWYELQHDMSYSSTSVVGYPGCVLMKMSLMNVQDVEDPVDWEPERKKMLIKKPYCLRVYIYQCRGLPPIDDNGLIDPYVKVRFAGSKQKTTIRKETQNPTFYECLEFHQNLPDDLRLAPNVLVQVWDSKSFGNVPVAAIRVPIADVTVTSSTLVPPPAPTWRELKGIDGKGKMGELLVSFQMIEKRVATQALSAPKDITPSLKKVWLDLHVVGLRSLIKLNYSGIRKPFIKFDVASHSYGGSIQTASSRVPSASNPNYLDRYILQTMLPEDPLLAPTLEVRVYDQRIRSRVLLGACNIDLRAKLPWNGEDYVSPCQHKILQDSMREKEKLKAKKSKPTQQQQLLLLDNADESSVDGKGSSASLGNDHDDDDKAIEDGGVGVFPPDRAALEAGSKYSALPSIVDADEIELLKASGAGMSVSDASELVQLESNDVKTSELRRVIGFPSTWASTEYLKGREWWIQSRKKGWGGSLEKYLKTYPFENYDLYRGHVAFNKFRRRRDTTKKVGLLKAVIIVCSKNPRYDEEYNKYSKMIKQNNSCVIRLYVLKARNLMPNFFGSADPYVKVTLGEKEEKSMKTMQKKTLSPDFYASFSFHTTLPGPSLLKVSVCDHSMFTGDKLLGETVIDLEDRFFHPKWISMGAIKPVEHRNLTKDGTSVSQGIATMWIEILTAEEAAKNPEIELKGPEKSQFEIRIVCWRSNGVPCMDGEFSDLFVKFFMEGDKLRQDTDTHWRCKNGNASWNWRVKIPITLPIKDRELGRLKVQLWEQNIITSNTIVGEHSINLFDWLMLAYKRVAQPVFPFSEKKQAIKKIQSGFLVTNADTEEVDDSMDDIDIAALDNEEMDDDAYGVAGNNMNSSTMHDDDDDNDDDNAPLLGRGSNNNNNNNSSSSYKGNDSSSPVISVTANPLRSAQSSKDSNIAANKAKGIGNSNTSTNAATKDATDGGDGDITEMLGQINNYLGLGDAIADDAEWLSMSYHDRGAGKILNRGRLAISISIVPQSEVDARPVGKGREEPNSNPYLPTPFGRLSFSFNPLTLIRELLGWKVLCCLICCCLCVCTLGIFMFVSTYLSGIDSIINLAKG